MPIDDILTIIAILVRSLSETALPLSDSFITLIKRKQVLHLNEDLRSNIITLCIPLLPVNTNTNDNIEVLRAIISGGVDSYFTMLQETGGLSDVSDTIIKKVKKNIQDLLLSLQRLQYSFQIPELISLIPSSLLEILKTDTPIADDSFTLLNSLQSIVNSWVMKINGVLALEHQIKDGSFMDEINFWSSKEETLVSIEEQIHSPDVINVLEFLRANKRSHSALGMLSSGTIREAIMQANNNAQFLRDIPFSDIMSSTDLESLQLAINSLFLQLKKLKANAYPTARAVDLLTLLINNIQAKYIELLEQLGYILLNLSSFEVMEEQALVILANFDDQLKSFVHLVREQQRRGREGFNPVKIEGLTSTKKAMENISVAKHTFEDITTAVSQFLSSKKITHLIPSTKQEISDELATLRSMISSVNIFSLLSDEGLAHFENKLSGSVYAVEKALINGLKLVLDATIQDALDPFEILHTYDYLLKRPNIRVSLGKYHGMLLASIDSTLDSIELQLKSISFVSSIIGSRGIPRISSRLVFGRQAMLLLSQTNTRLELILSPEWTSYPEGQKYANKITRIMSELNVDSLTEEWLSNVSEVILSPFSKEQILTSDNRDTQFDLRINLSDIEVTLLNEFNCLKLLKFDIHERINCQYVSKLQQILPYAAKLQNAVYNLKYCFESSEVLGNMDVLVMPLLTSLVDQFSVFFHKSWKDISTAGQFLQTNNIVDENIEIFGQIEHLTSLLIESVKKIETLKLIRLEMYRALENLVLCDFNDSSIKDGCNRVQRVVNEMLVGLYPNLDNFIEKLNGNIKEIIMCKFLSVMAQFKSQWNSTALPLEMEQKVHKLLVHNSSLTISPPLESSKQFFFDIINQHCDVVTSQIVISGSLEATDATHHFSNDYLFHYVDILETVSNTIGDAQSFCLEWSSFKSIWSFDLESLNVTLGLEIPNWIEYIENLKNMRSKFDTLKSTQRFGLICIDYSLSQVRLHNELESWLHQINEIFAMILLKETQKYVHQLQELKATLAVADAHFSMPSTVVQFLHIIGSAISQMVLIDEDILNIKLGHRLILQSKCKLPVDWIYYDQIQCELDSIAALLNTKKQYIRNNFDALVSISRDEKAKTLEAVQKVSYKWQKKQFSSNTDYTTAIKSIENFEKMLSDISHKIEFIVESYKLLELPLEMEGLTVSDINTELKELKSIWVSVGTFLNAINGINILPWDSVTLSSLKSAMNDIMINANTFPKMVQTFPAFQKNLTYLKDAIRALPTLMELKSEAVIAFHWKEIFTTLVGTAAPSDLTVGDILGLKPYQHDKYLRGVATKAQAEKLIADSISAIQKQWSELSFDTHLFDNQYLIITSWDQIFQMISEDLNTLSSIKVSVHYERFSKITTTLEMKLDRLYTIMDIWIECQKLWVYLYGTFNKNDIVRSMMPIEATRFDNMTLELKSLMKSLKKNSIIFEALTIPHIDNTLRRVLETLERVKISLSAYLEKQREEVPRLYFIGNGDLLELLGNSTSVSVVSKHIKKMFPGVSHLVSDQEFLLISGVSSADDEVVLFDDPISLIQSNGLKDTLINLEQAILKTLSNLTIEAASLFQKLFDEGFTKKSLLQFLDSYPNQVCCLSLQLLITLQIERSIKYSSFAALTNFVNDSLDYLTSSLYDGHTVKARLKIENFIIELIYYRGLIRKMNQKSNISFVSPEWYFLQKYYLNPDLDPCRNLTIRQGNSLLYYGYEYLGIQRKLAYTPLINSSFVSMSESLNQNKGTLLLGPAGTGKTEAIKALGYNLGRMVFVFCCDESFDFESVSRIMIGISCMGAWGCFDEFNRLENTMLSAMSTQIEKIETSLSNDSAHPIEILGKSIKVSRDTGIFITYNPLYEGRTTLPDNLKSKYLTFMMNVPDVRDIAEVLFSTQGFLTGPQLAIEIVKVFERLQRKCSPQIHYDFGLRSMKSVLITCGKIKRMLINASQDIPELQILVQSLFNVVLPKLIPEDQSVFTNAINALLPDFKYFDQDSALTTILYQICNTSSLSSTPMWIQKCHQVFEIQKLHTGIMLVGQSGTGKTTLFRSVIDATYQLSGKGNVIYTLDPKVIGKDSMFGTINYATREWTDGVFTSIIRKSIESSKGENKKNIWIVMDGDIEPEWVENLNSVLDDNKALTLPNGERLTIPENMRIVFEVDSLAHATPATVSRCGIVWIGDNMFDSFQHYEELRSKALGTKIEDEEMYNEQLISENMSVRDFKIHLENALSMLLDENTVHQIESLALSYKDELDSNISFKWESFFTLLRESLARLVMFVVKNIHVAHSDYFIYFEKQILLSLFWSFAGGLCYADRNSFEQGLKQIRPLLKPLESLSSHLMYSEVDKISFKWTDISESVTKIEIEPNMITKPDLIIPTVDTAIYEDILFKILNQHKPIILCGPPGAGKTMLLLSSLRKSQTFSLVNLNFSKETVPDLIIKTLEHNCIYRMTSTGLLMQPPLSDKWIVLFCDELNLPKLDKYGSQGVISFLRGVIVNGGFWHPKRKEWVTLQNVQFVGACNPSDGTTRQKLSKRFQNHCSVIMVDYPGEESLLQIYETFSTAVLRCVPDLIGYADTLTRAMVDVYYQYKETFVDIKRPHYICSPRELTRWTRGIFKGLRHIRNLKLEGLVRLWAHEGLRLFSDKLSTEDDRVTVFEIIKSVSCERFPYIDEEKALSLPILYSDWLSYEYEPVNKDDLRKFVKQKLKTFGEEEFNTNILLFEDILDHSLRIDRVLKAVQGHLMLVGQSGCGKTTLVKFVAWMNGIRSHQLNVFKGYKLDDFDDTLRNLLWKASIGNEKICFIIDESTILDSSFLERMNTLLANAEIPGLFEGEAFTNLMTACAKASSSEGIILESEEELYSWFTSQVAVNFHVVFTMSDPYKGDSPLFAQSSALFNRCVIDWMGNWSCRATEEVARQMLAHLPIDNFNINKTTSFRESVISILTTIQKSEILMGFEIECSPLNFVSMVNVFVDMFVDYQTTLQMKNSHSSTGLDKMKETFFKVKKLNETLKEKQDELGIKEKEARLVLDKMIMDQNESERKQDMSIEMQKIFTKQEEKILQKRDSVRRELQEVEPLIYEAQQGVQNIKKQHLTEMRAMRNPPDTVKMVLESVCVLLGYQVSTWASVQQVVRQDDFIANIVSYDSDSQLTTSMIQFMETNYLTQPTYNYESANRASKALGPLMMWVKAQLRYASIVTKVEPLRNELQRLEQELIESKNKLIAIKGMIDDLQLEIESYKLKYSETIRDIEAIKMEMKTVECKVSRSVKLLESLKSERMRWKANIETYQAESEFFIGDLIINAIFSTYCGNLSESKRIEFIKHLKGTLEEYGVKYDPEYDVLTKLSTPGAILDWRNSGLPHDNQFIENTILLNSKYCYKYPVFIDPTGQMLDFMKHSIKSLVVTSFLEDGYTQKLENCLKFGGSILIMDGECYDPIINRLIANDVSILGGGRQLVRIGDNEVDFDPRFRLYIHTKDETVKFIPFVRNRIKLLNFKLTDVSVLNECLNLALKSEKPEIESTRLELQKTRDHCGELLRELESDLLKTINQSKDDILDNDELAIKLEQLKAQSTEMALKSANADAVIKTFNSVIGEFVPLGELYVAVANFVGSLWKVNPIYKFSQGYTKHILLNVLRSNKGQPIAALKKALVEKLCQNLSTTLLQDDIEAVSQAIRVLCDKHDVIGYEWCEETIEQAIMKNKFNLLRSCAGFDPTPIIQQTGSGQGANIVKYSLGQVNGAATAIKMIVDGMKNGTWVIIENIEVSNQFITRISKVLEENGALSVLGFKLFMTSKLDTVLPSLIIEMCDQVIMEIPNGIRPILANHVINKNYEFNIVQEVAPKELKAVYFGIIWVYAFIMEELKLQPLTFTTGYDINETDLTIALRFAKAAIMNTAKSEFFEGLVPFDVLKQMIGKILFGGKMENADDKIRLEKLVQGVLEEGLFDGIKLAGGLSSPTRYNDKEAIITWVENLPEEDPLSWFGLDESVRTEIKSRRNAITNINVGKLITSPN